MGSVEGHEDKCKGVVSRVLGVRQARREFAGRQSLYAS